MTKKVNVEGASLLSSLEYFSNKTLKADISRNSTIVSFFLPHFRSNCHLTQQNMFNDSEIKVLYFFLVIKVCFKISIGIIKFRMQRTKAVKIVNSAEYCTFYQHFLSLNKNPFCNNLQKMMFSGF